MLDTEEILTLRGTYQLKAEYAFCAFSPFVWRCKYFDLFPCLLANCTVSYTEVIYNIPWVTRFWDNALQLMNLHLCSWNTVRKHLTLFALFYSVLCRGEGDSRVETPFRCSGWRSDLHIICIPFASICNASLCCNWLVAKQLLPSPLSEIESMARPLVCKLETKMQTLCTKVTQPHGWAVCPNAA